MSRVLLALILSFGVRFASSAEISGVVTEVQDGDSLTLGYTVLKLYVTPGHTPGVTSLEFPVSDQGRKYKAFMFGGIGLNTVNGVKAVQQYIDSVRRVMTIPDVQVSLSNHPNARGLQDLRDKKLDPEGFRTSMRLLLANAEKKLEAEKTANRP
mgnify:CR=1 FL=1